MSNTFPEYEEYDAVGLAMLVRAGKVTPAELLEAAIQRMNQRNPKMNAVVYDMSERARAKLPELPKGPLHGVPFVVKDLKLQIQGTPTTNSTKLNINHKATGTSVLATRYEQAGLQIIGKTNTPEFGIMGITEPTLRGPCRNPWNPDHTPGGSSGGSAAAVAAGIVPAAHGGDGGGSIRIPASCCGLFGLKPTRGRVSMAPFAAESWGGFVQEHILARSVRDSAAFLDIADPAVPGEPYVAPAKARPFAEEVGVAPGKLRIAFTTESLFADKVHPDCVAAVQDAVRLLQDLGHEVVEAKPTFSRDELVRAYFLLVCTGVANFVEKTAAAAGVAPRASDYEPSTWLMASIGWKTNAPTYLAAQQSIHHAGRQVAEFFTEYPYFVSSTIATPPVKIGELLPKGKELVQMSALRMLPFKRLLDFALHKIGNSKISYTPNTQLFNQTGQPAMSVPLWWNQQGLPIGVQVAAQFGDEAGLFRLASQLEEARPWQQKFPAMK